MTQTAVRQKASSLRVRRGGRRLAARAACVAGEFLAPNDTPYDRQLLLEQVDRHVRSYGAVYVELREREWVVSHAPGSGRPCAACGRTRVTAVHYQIGDRRVCRRCAHALLAPIST